MWMILVTCGVDFSIFCFGIQIIINNMCDHCWLSAISLNFRKFC